MGIYGIQYHYKVVTTCSMKLNPQCRKASWVGYITLRQGGAIYAITCKIGIVCFVLLDYHFLEHKVPFAANKNSPDQPALFVCQNLINC